VEIPYSQTFLDNGLRVIVHECRSLPIVAVNLWYHVGSKNEQPGRTGFAHLFEHLMFEGSKHYDRGYFHPLQEAGAALNGSTNPIEPITGRSCRRRLWNLLCGWNRTAWGTCCRH
jgi:zinc protease